MDFRYTRPPTSVFRAYSHSSIANEGNFFLSLPLRPAVRPRLYSPGWPAYTHSDPHPLKPSRL